MKFPKQAISGSIRATESSRRAQRIVENFRQTEEIQITHIAFSFFPELSHLTGAGIMQYILRIHTVQEAFPWERQSARVRTYTRLYSTNEMQSVYK